MIDTEIVAFDFFDTIVHRNCHPEEVLYEWARKCSRILNFQIEASEMYKVRKEVEKENLLSTIDELSYETFISKIYDIIAKNLKYNVISKEEFVKFSYNLEVAIEKREIYGDLQIIAKIKKYYQLNKKIIIISDFYLGKEFFRIILQKLKVEKLISHIFVSSDYGKRKSTGNLYQAVLEELDVKPQEVTMIGDNVLSDYNIPRDMGMNALLIKYKNRETIYTRNKLKHVYKLLTHRDPRRNPFNGYTSELLYFFDKLYRNLFEEGDKEVLFCAREGQFMKVLFDKYQLEYWGDTLISSKYFYVSRKAVLVASLNDFEHESFMMIFRQYKELNIMDFMKNLGMKEEFIIKICKKNHIELNEKITSSPDNKIMNILKRDIEFRENYDSIRNSQRQYFMKYLEENCEGYEEGRLVFIDVGWKGTIQDCIRKIVPDKVRIKGYYIGLITKEYGCLNPEQKIGILFSDYPKKSANYDVLKHTYMFYEFMFAADHGSVDGYYANDKGEILPAICDHKYDHALYDYIENYQNILIGVFEQMAFCHKKIFYTPSELYKEVVKNALWRNCIDYPCVWIIEQKMKNLTVENFGCLDSRKKRNSWGGIFKHFKENPFSMTDYSVRIIEKCHLTILMPFVYIYCRILYGINLRKVEY